MGEGKGELLKAGDEEGWEWGQQEQGRGSKANSDWFRKGCVKASPATGNNTGKAGPFRLKMTLNKDFRPDLMEDEFLVKKLTVYNSDFEQLICKN